MIEQVILHRETSLRGFTADPSWSASSNLISVAALELGKNVISAILILKPDGKLVKSFFQLTAVPPTELASGTATQEAAVSPDGKFVAYMRLDSQGSSTKLKFVIQNIEGGLPIREVVAPGWAQYIGWTPDGSAIAFLLYDTQASARHLPFVQFGNRPEGDRVVSVHSSGKL